MRWRVLAIALAGCGFGLFAARSASAADADPLESVFPSLPLGGGSTTAGAALTSLPDFHSYASASATLYINFAGQTASTWGGGYAPGATPAYDIDGDPTTFSSAELTNINEILQRVAEKYSPFNIDVTDVAPANTNPGHMMEVVVGGDGTNGAKDASGNPSYWAGGRYGGISYVGSFQGAGGPNISYVFPGNLANGVPRYSAEAIAHEAGHGFGLNHQSDYVNGVKTTEYSLGTYIYDNNLPGVQQPEEPGSRSPIMGNSYFADRGLWWNGTSGINGGQTQDDLSVISSSANGFGYRPEGTNNSFGNAAPLALDDTGKYKGSGVIANTSERDYFSYQATGGLVDFVVNVAPYAAMLDSSLQLYDSHGNLIADSITANLGESISMNLSAGLYDLVVSSAGNYGDIGQYFITATGPAALIPEPTFIGIAMLSTVSVCRRRRA